jgi:hypothetical protein
VTSGQTYFCVVQAVDSSGSAETRLTASSRKHFGERHTIILVTHETDIAAHAGASSVLATAKAEKDDTTPSLIADISQLGYRNYTKLT